MKKLMLIGLLLAFASMQMNSTLLAAGSKDKKKALTSGQKVAIGVTAVGVLTAAAVAAGVMISPETFKNFQESVLKKVETARNTAGEAKNWMGSVYTSAKSNLNDAFQWAFGQKAKEEAKEEGKDPATIDTDKSKEDAKTNAADVMATTEKVADNAVASDPTTNKEEANEIKDIVTTEAAKAIAKAVVEQAPQGDASAKPEATPTPSPTPEPTPVPAE